MSDWKEYRFIKPPDQPISEWKPVPPEGIVKELRKAMAAADHRIDVEIRGKNGSTARLSSA
jgi:hypothetical protein